MSMRWSSRHHWTVLQSSLLLAIVAAACGAEQVSPRLPEPPASGLRPVTQFEAIDDDELRSATLFVEAGKVIQSPRCLNCHPSDREPTQGDDLHAHVPIMRADEEGHALPGIECRTCHGIANVVTYGADIESIPGNARWALAPASMAWQGKTLLEICEQIKDPARNGGFSLEKLHEHMAHDPLVGWAWSPGPGRVPAPGTQRQLGELIAAWIETGAHCPAR